jgi:hypothetical protein
VLAEELVDIGACGVIPVNRNHRPKIYLLRAVRRRAIIPMIVTSRRR